MVNGTLLNFGKKYEDNIRVIFDQWPKLHLGLDALSNQRILKGVYLECVVPLVCITYTYSKSKTYYNYLGCLWELT